MEPIGPILIKNMKKWKFYVKDKVYFDYLYI